MSTGHEAVWICLFGASLIPWSCLSWQSGTSLQFQAPKNTFRPFPKQQVEDTGGFPRPLPALFPPNPSKTLPEGIITMCSFLELSPVALAPVGAGPPELQPQPSWKTPLTPPRAPTPNLPERMEQPGTAVGRCRAKPPPPGAVLARCGSLISPFPFSPCSDYQGLADPAGMCCPIRRCPALPTAGLRPGGGCRPFCV